MDKFLKIHLPITSVWQNVGRCANIQHQFFNLAFVGNWAFVFQIPPLRQAVAVIGKCYFSWIMMHPSTISNLFPNGSLIIVLSFSAIMCSSVLILVCSKISFLLSAFAKSSIWWSDTVLGIFVLIAAPAYNSGFAPPLDSWCAVIKIYLKRQRKAAKRYRQA